jgi:hypothetical protein
MSSSSETASAAVHSSICDQEPKKQLDFKPIRIDNWGVFLLQKLHNFYRREESCDLELIFNDSGVGGSNRSVSVHSSVAHVCTDFFKIELERQKTPGRLILPDLVAPATLLPIVQFLYTGRLALNSANFEAIYRAAKLLGLDMLAKLMESQLQQCMIKPKIPSDGALPYRMTDVLLPATAEGEEDVLGRGNPVSKYAFNGIKYPSAGNVCIKSTDNNKTLVEKESAVDNDSHKGQDDASAVVHSPRGVRRSSSSGAEPAAAAAAPERKRKLFSKVVKCQQNPNPVKSIYTTDPVKKLTSSDVFMKYNGVKSSPVSANLLSSELPDSSSSSTTKVIMDLIRKNPRLVSEGRPTKVKIKQKSAAGHERLVNVTVVAKVNGEGKRSIEIIQSPEYDPDPVRPAGPWSCTKCIRNGSVLEFDSYHGCRYHMTKVHSVKFDPKSCEECGEKCKNGLAKHRLDAHDIPLAAAEEEKVEQEEVQEEQKSYECSLWKGSDRKRRKFRYKKARWATGGTSSAAEDHVVGGQEGEELEDDQENEVKQQQQQVIEKDYFLGVDVADCFRQDNAVLASDSVAEETHLASTMSTSATATTTTTALPNFQELRGGGGGICSTLQQHPPSLTAAPHEPVQVLNVAVPVGCDDTMIDMQQQHSILIWADDQQHYFDGSAYNQNCYQQIDTSSICGGGQPQYQQQPPPQQIMLSGQQQQQQVILPSLPSMTEYNRQPQPPQPIFFSPVTASSSTAAGALAASMSSPSSSSFSSAQQPIHIPTFNLPRLEQCDIMRDFVHASNA